MQKWQIHISVDFPQLTLCRWQVSPELMDAPSGSNRKAHNPDLANMGRVHRPSFVISNHNSMSRPSLSNPPSALIFIVLIVDASSCFRFVTKWIPDMSRYLPDYLYHETQNFHQNPWNAVFVTDFVDRIGFHGSKIYQTVCNAAFVGDFVGGIDIRDSKIEREFPRGILCS